VKPQSIGRVLGIGVRVAGRIAGQHIASQSPNGASAAPGTPVRARVAGQGTRNVGKGISGFFKPFRTIGGKILLEVIGVFFLLPVLVFTPVLWRTRASWQHGPDHRTFLSAAVIIAIFLYLGVTSFWRAARRR
jgi:hypothetical protein